MKQCGRDLLGLFCYINSLFKVAWLKQTISGHACCFVLSCVSILIHTQTSDYTYIYVYIINICIYT